MRGGHSYPPPLTCSSWYKAQHALNHNHRKSQPKINFKGGGYECPPRTRSSENYLGAKLQLPGMASGSGACDLPKRGGIAYVIPGLAKDDIIE